MNTNFSLRIDGELLNQAQPHQPANLSLKSFNVSHWVQVGSELGLAAAACNIAISFLLWGRNM